MQCIDTVCWPASLDSSGGTDGVQFIDLATTVLPVLGLWIACVTGLVGRNMVDMLSIDNTVYMQTVQTEDEDRYQPKH